MKIINGERASGKTDGLIFAAYATGARGTSKTRTHFIEKYGFDPWEDKQ